MVDLEKVITELTKLDSDEYINYRNLSDTESLNNFKSKIDEINSITNTILHRVKELSLYIEN